MQRDKITVFIDLLKADARRMLRETFQAVSTDIYGSYPQTSMSRWRANLLYARRSHPGRSRERIFRPAPDRQTATFPFQPVWAPRPLPFKRLYPFHRGEHPARGHQKRTDYKLLTALALAPGVLNTTIPLFAASVHRDVS